MDVKTNQVIENLVKDEYLNIKKILLSKFGYGYNSYIEDVIQESIISAIVVWNKNQIPEKPKEWLITVSKNKLIDIIRKNNRQQSTELTDQISNELQAESVADYANQKNLDLIFLICNPLLSDQEVLVLSLYWVLDLNVNLISNLLLINPTAVSQRIVRAKGKLKLQKSESLVAYQSEILQRLPSVLQVIYQIFTYGYNSSEYENTLNKEVMFEAIGMIFLLIENTQTNTSETRSLLALMLFQASRVDARLSKSGDIIKLEDQDRKKWDYNLIKLGNYFLDNSGNYNVGKYKLEAHIASTYSNSKDFGTINWSFILKMYDNLINIDDSAFVKFNRAIVLQKVHGTDQAMQLLLNEELKQKLAEYYLYYVTLGDFYVDLNNLIAAKNAYQQALNLVTNQKVKEFIQKKYNFVEFGN